MSTRQCLLDVILQSECFWVRGKKFDHRVELSLGGDHWHKARRFSWSIPLYNI